LHTENQSIKKYKQFNQSLRIVSILIFAAMAKVFTTEITSEQITSDNPIHQRLFKAYVAVKDKIEGNVLEVGCGEGRGVSLMLERAKSFTAVDKIKPVVDELQKKYPTGRFISMNIPPLDGLQDNTYDTIVSFQVIEHIQDDSLYLKELHRVLKPGGTLYITTPNRKMSLSRNPAYTRISCGRIKVAGGHYFSHCRNEGHHRK
jgi:2-polyprenyl-3-methyl-5-hydroxy-6-metoxy-1,4-benzoquinol methylase